MYGNCNTTYTLTNSNNPSTSQSNMSQYYAASDWITSSRTIYFSIADSVRYKAGNYVKLLPGFDTQSGANFEAKIGNCNGSGGSLAPPPNYMTAQQAIIYRCYGALIP